MAEDPVKFPLAYGPWIILDRKIVYQDPWLKVTRDAVTRPDGQPGSYSVSHMKQGVTVLALDEIGNCHLTEEFHYAVGKTTIECVSGGIDGAESPPEAAQRELAEELGLKAAKWTPLGTVDPFTAIAFSPTSLWLAEELQQTEKKPDAAEIIKTVVFPLDDVLNMVNDGTITHAPSVVTILKTWILKKNGNAT